MALWWPAQSRQPIRFAFRIGIRRAAAVSTELTASINGTLVVTLAWPPPSRGVYDPELFLIAPDQSWIYADVVPPNRRGTIRIARGGKYRIVVLAYGQFPDRFELAVEELP